MNITQSSLKYVLSAVGVVILVSLGVLYWNAAEMRKIASSTPTACMAKEDGKTVVCTYGSKNVEMLAEDMIKDSAATINGEFLGIDRAFLVAGTSRVYMHVIPVAAVHGPYYWYDLVTKQSGAFNFAPKAGEFITAPQFSPDFALAAIPVHMNGKDFYKFTKVYIVDMRTEQLVDTLIAPEGQTFLASVNLPELKTALQWTDATHLKYTLFKAINSSVVDAASGSYKLSAVKESVWTKK